MGEIVSFRLNEDLEKDLAKLEKRLMIERSEIVRRLLAEAIKQWQIQHALEDLSNKKISLGKAAENAEVSIWDMIDLAKQKNIDWIEYTEEDLKKDFGIK